MAPTKRTDFWRRGALAAWYCGRHGPGLLIAAILLVLAGHGAVNANAAPPNIVLVLADDLGYGDLQCFGDKIVQTPNLDRLAAEGLKLTDCYAAAANCSPARAGLMTGRTPARAGITDWIPAFSPMHLRRQEVTVATLLRRAGYATCLSGKWHLNSGLEDARQPQPDAHGFDHWFATQNVAHPGHHNPVNFVRNGKPVGALEGYSADLVVDEAIRWLGSQRDKSRPFFLYVAFHEPHEPIATAPKYVSLYPSDDPSFSHFYGNITQLDAAFGRLMQALDEQGLRDSTLVFFTSDNGPAITGTHPHGSAGPLRLKKGHLYDGGIRVPGIVRWPARIKPGTVSHEPVSGLDVLPTLCAVAGIEVPRDRPLDGASFVPVFEGKTVARRQPLFWFYYGAWSEPKVAMRDGDWKLLAHLDYPGPADRNHIRSDVQQALRRAELTVFELYNLRDDVGESRNLAGSEPERLKMMSTGMKALYREVRDETPEWPPWTWNINDSPRAPLPPYYRPKKSGAGKK